MIDNFDSFTYNLVDYFKRCDCEVIVYRNNVNPNDLEKVDFDLLVLSPGPSTPRQAGNLMEIIGKFYQTKPIFGICLGHQALIEFFGGTLKLVPPQHGKADIIINDQQGIYSGLDRKIEVARYHSLAGENIPNCFQITADSTSDNTVMSIRHKVLPIEGVQFHPESVLSMRDNVGMRIIENVVNGKISTGNIGYTNLMKTLNSDKKLTKNQIEHFIEIIKDDQLSDDQKLILLVAFSFKLKKPEYLHQFIEVLQSNNNFIPNNHISETGIDICGTGGSGLPRPNTSTLAAVLLSAVGVPIIKHGNKAASGRFGSFDLLETIGVNINTTQTEIENAFKTTNLAFLYARSTHPVVGKFSGSRARVGVPTIFNVIGPLLNPYSPQRQFMGTSFDEYFDVIFETAVLMGKTHFTLVRAEDGLDEISISTKTKVKTYKNGETKEFYLSPEDFGIEAVPFDKIKTENKNENIKVAQDFLSGKTDTDHHKIIAANAAFIYSEFYKETSLKEAYKLMLETIKKGELQKHLENYNEAILSLNELIA